MKIQLFISFLILSTIAFARSSARSGDRGGNGGDAIVCFDKEVNEENIKTQKAISTKVKDYWEYDQMINGLKVDLGAADNYQQKVMHVLNRLKIVDEFRADKLIERFKDNSFYSLVSRGQIPTVDDSNSYLKPSKAQNCYEVQVAFQILSPRMFQSKVLIDKDIFSSMDNVNKAGLILHELLYEHDIKYAKATDSDTIRWFNYIVSSDLRALFPDTDEGYSSLYAKMIKENKLDYFDYSSQFKATNDYKSINPVAVDERINSSLLPADMEILSSSLVDDGSKVIKGKIIYRVKANTFLDEKRSISIVANENYEYIFNESYEKLSGKVFRNKEQLKSIKNSSSSFQEFELESNELNLNDGSVFGDNLKLTIGSHQKVSGVKRIVFQDEVLVCLKKCNVSIRNNRIESLNGLVEYNDYKLNLRSLQDGYLQEPMIISVSNGKKTWESSIQRVQLVKGRVVGKIFIPKSKRKDISVSIAGASLIAGRCLKSKCLVELEFEKGHLANINLL